MPDIPSSVLNGIAKTPKQGLPFVRASLDYCPAFSLRQADDTVDMAGFDPVTRARHTLDEFALPAAVRKKRKDLFHIPAGKNGRLERPGMVVRVDVRFGPYEPMQRAAIVEMELAKGW